MGMSQEQWRSADFFHMSLELPIVVNGGFINLEAIFYLANVCERHFTTYAGCFDTDAEIVQNRLNRRLTNKPKEKTNKS